MCRVIILAVPPRFMLTAHKAVLGDTVTLDSTLWKRRHKPSGQPDNTNTRTMLRYYYGHLPGLGEEMGKVLPTLPHFPLPSPVRQTMSRAQDWPYQGFNHNLGPTPFLQWNRLSWEAMSSLPLEDSSSS